MTKWAYGATIGGQEVVLAAISSLDGITFQFHPDASTKMRLEHPNERKAVMSLYDALASLVKDKGIKMALFALTVECHATAAAR